MGRRVFGHFRIVGCLSLCLIFCFIYPSLDWRPMSGEPLAAAAAPKASDIRGHWAERQVVD